jgi:hypothetical protein
LINPAVQNIEKNHSEIVIDYESTVPSASTTM